MKFSTSFLAATLAWSALSAAVPLVDKTLVVTEEGAHHLSPREEQYTVMTFDDLEEEASVATQEQIAASINYLAKIWSAKGANWALTGGIAMQKYGMTERPTKDSDIAVSMLPLDITNGAAADPNIQYPPALMAASGTVTHSDLGPSLEDTVMIDGWPIVGILSLVKAKVRRPEEKDIVDVGWLCQKRLNDVTAIASQIDYHSRLSFASDAKASDSPDFALICQGLLLDPTQVPSK